MEHAGISDVGFRRIVPPSKQDDREIFQKVDPSWSNKAWHLLHGKILVEYHRGEYIRPRKKGGKPDLEFGCCPSLNQNALSREDLGLNSGVK